MKEKTREKIINTFRIIILSLIFSAAIGYSLADWVPPPGTPPFGNTPPPINVGGATQVKEGNLFINNLLWAKKARSSPTVDSDTDDTLVTKGYMKGKISAGGTSAWTDVPTSDTAPFDTKCSYRFSYTGSGLFAARSGIVLYPTDVLPAKIYQQFGFREGIISSDKTRARADSVLSSIIGSITLLQKQC